LRAYGGAILTRLGALRLRDGKAGEAQQGEKVTKPIEFKPKPYATRIPGRKPEFKSHSTLGLVKSAVGQRIRFDPRVNSYQKVVDGIFTCDLTVFVLKDGEYKPWIEVRRGMRRSAYPDLMPRDIPPDRFPDDPPGHASRNLYEHLLRCPSPTCQAAEKWSDNSRSINENAAKALLGGGWVIRGGEWFCKTHAEAS